jgi:hypothetical protein
MSLFKTIAAATQDTVETLSKFGPQSGEVMVDPAGWHGHHGDNSIFDLTAPNLDFQLFRSKGDLTFIHGNGDTASYWGGDNQEIFDFGQNTTLRFSELDNLKVNVYGLENDPTAKIVFYNAVDPRIVADGQGGTVIDGVAFHGATIRPDQVSFLHSDTPLSAGGLVPVS